MSDHEVEVVAPSVKRPVVMPDTFLGGLEDEWEDRLNNFEACAKINWWNEELMCLFLGARMKGAAQEVCDELEEETKKDWSRLRDKLGSRFRGSKQEDICKSQFLVKKRQPGESLLEFGNAIRRLSRKAYPSMEAQVRDELARNQFLRGLTNSRLAMDLPRQLPPTLDDTIRVAVEWETIEQDLNMEAPTAVAGAGMATGSSHPSTANAVSGSDTSREMLELMRELTAMLKDKNSRGRGMRPQGSNRGRGRGGGRGMSRGRCWECGQMGNLSRDCQQKGCWNCGETGHFQADCTKLSNSLEN